MFNKLLLIFLSFMSGKAIHKEPANWLAIFGGEKLRVMTGVITAVIVSLIMFSAGLNLILNDIQQQSANQQQLAASSVSLVGAGLLLLFALMVGVCFRRPSWGLGKVVKTKDHPEPSPLTFALSALILDFVEERKQNRDQKNEQTKDFSASSNQENPAPWH